MNFPNKAARQDYLLKQSIEGGDVEVEWGDIKDKPDLVEVGDITSASVEKEGLVRQASPVEDVEEGGDVEAKINELLSSLRASGVLGA